MTKLDCINQREERNGYRMCCAVFRKLLTQVQLKRLQWLSHSKGDVASEKKNKDGEREGQRQKLENFKEITSS